MHTTSLRSRRTDPLTRILLPIYFAFLTFATTYSYLSHTVSQSILNFDLGFSRIEVDETDEGIIVTNTGTVDCYVRVAVNGADSDVYMEYVPEAEDLWTDAYAEEGEDKLDGYYYCTTVIEPQAESPVLNIAHDSDVLIYAESVQAGASADYMEAWEDFL